MKIAKQAFYGWLMHMIDQQVKRRRQSVCGV